MEEIDKPHTLSEVTDYVWHSGVYSLVKSDPDKKEQYNNVPVHWCKTCGSLLIVNLESSLKDDLKGYCAKCGGTTIETGHIKDWELINNK